MEQFFGFQGKLDKVEPLYRQCMAIDEKVHGKEHPDYATSLNNLAQLYQDQVLFFVPFCSITTPRYGAFFRFSGEIGQSRTFVPTMHGYRRKDSWERTP